MARGRWGLWATTRTTQRSDSEVESPEPKPPRELVRRRHLPPRLHDTHHYWSSGLLLGRRRTHRRCLPICGHPRRAHPRTPRCLRTFGTAWLLIRRGRPATSLSSRMRPRRRQLRDRTRLSDRQLQGTAHLRHLLPIRSAARPSGPSAPRAQPGRVPPRPRWRVRPPGPRPAPPAG